MRQSSIQNYLFHRIFAAVLTALIIGLPAAASAEEADGTIEIELVKAGFIIGGSGGSGTLHYKGKDYPVSIGGVSLGATIGVSKAELVGEVFNLKKVEDIAGIYSAGQASYALAGGEKHADLRNSKDVRLLLKGKQIGLEFALDLSGMKIELK